MNIAPLDRRLCVAPMMTHTDRHFRYLLRLISRRVMLYTEMIATGSLIHGKQFHRLEFSPQEHPLGIQLGGNHPDELSQCARIAEQRGYDEINLNIGCPSDKVKIGQFGACLMARPELVAECVAAIAARVSVPVTVKTRTGIDNEDSYECLHRFIKTVADGGCRTFIIHARKAWLQGLSPKQNREIPPLDYSRVHQIKKDFPHLEIIINGGFQTLEQSQEQLQFVDGVMIGRAFCHNPYLLAGADRLMFGHFGRANTRSEILEQFTHYAEQQMGQGTELHQMMRHVLGLFQGQPGARVWRRYLSENIFDNNSGVEVIEDALHLVQAAY